MNSRERGLVEGIKRFLKSKQPLWTDVRRFKAALDYFSCPEKYIALAIAELNNNEIELIDRLHNLNEFYVWLAYFPEYREILKNAIKGYRLSTFRAFDSEYNLLLYQQGVLNLEEVKETFTSVNYFSLCCIITEYEKFPKMPGLRDTCIELVKSNTSIMLSALQNASYEIYYNNSRDREDVLMLFVKCPELGFTEEEQKSYFFRYADQGQIIRALDSGDCTLEDIAEELVDTDKRNRLLIKLCSKENRKYEKAAHLIRQWAEEDDYKAPSTLVLLLITNGVLSFEEAEPLMVKYVKERYNKDSITLVFNDWDDYDLICFFKDENKAREIFEGSAFDDFYYDLPWRECWNDIDEENTKKILFFVKSMTDSGDIEEEDLFELIDDGCFGEITGAIERAIENAERDAYEEACTDKLIKELTDFLGPYEWEGSPETGHKLLFKLPWNKVKDILTTYIEQDGLEDYGGTDSFLELLQYYLEMEGKLDTDMRYINSYADDEHFNERLADELAGL